MCEDEGTRDQTGRKETGGKTMGAKETGGNETGTKETGAKEMRAKAIGGNSTGANAPGAQDSLETGGKGEGEMDNILPGDTTAGKNATEEIRRKSYYDVVIEGVRKKARVFVWELILRKTDRALSKGGRHGGLFSRNKNRGCHRGYNCHS